VVKNHRVAEISWAAVRASEPDFGTLATLRLGLQELDRFSETVSREHGCTASMFQLLLAVKTARRGRGLDIGMLATSLRVRHPSAAEMARKAQSSGFLAASVDPDDGRRVLLSLTDHGEQTIDSLAHAHVEELRRRRAGFVAALNALT